MTPYWDCIALQSEPQDPAATNFINLYDIVKSRHLSTIVNCDIFILQTSLHRRNGYQNAAIATPKHLAHSASAADDRNKSLQSLPQSQCQKGSSCSCIPENEIDAEVFYSMSWSSRLHFGDGIASTEEKMAWFRAAAAGKSWSVGKSTRTRKIFRCQFTQ